MSYTSFDCRRRISSFCLEVSYAESGQAMTSMSKGYSVSQRMMIRQILSARVCLHYGNLIKVEMVGTRMAYLMKEQGLPSE